MKINDLTGQQFEKLKVLKRVTNDKKGNSRWLCLCNCKNKSKIIALGFNLKRNHTKSCGCLAKYNALKHGHRKNRETTREYRSWCDMIQRCTNPKHKYWKNYGGRGITICQRWLKPENFIRDMGEKPSECTLERINNEKRYSPENCCWATREKQARNKRNNVYITHDGKTQLLVEWVEETGIPEHIIRWRITHGWIPEKALTTPVGKYKKRKSNDKIEI